MTREEEASPCNLPQDKSVRIESWFRTYSVELRTFIVRNLIHRNEIDDLLHDVFVVALKKQSSYRESGHARAYLYRIAKNLILSRRRKNRQLEKTGQANLDNDAFFTPMEQNTAEQASIVQSQLATLGSLERVVVRFRIEEAMPFKKIAEILESPLNTVISCFHRAMIKLRKACASEHSKP